MPRSAQDDARENRLRDLFNLVRPPEAGRQGIDGVLSIEGHEIEFELKSTTTRGGSISTVRDFGPDHIRKWEKVHWIVGFWRDDELTNCRYGSPDNMKPWVDRTWEYIRRDFEMAQLIPALVTPEVMFRIIGEKNRYSAEDARRLHKNQFTAQQYRAYMDAEDGYTPERMLEVFKERVKYLIERGSTLNNPHIPADFVRQWTAVNADHASNLRALVKAWLDSKPPQALARGDKT